MVVKKMKKKIIAFFNKLFRRESSVDNLTAITKESKEVDIKVKTKKRSNYKEKLLKKLKFLRLVLSQRF